MFVIREKWVDVGLVEELCPLGLREDEVREDDETEIGIERDPSQRQLGSSTYMALECYTMSI